MIAIFLILIISFMIIWFMIADRAENSEALMPENEIVYVRTDRKAFYN